MLAHSRDGNMGVARRGVASDDCTANDGAATHLMRRVAGRHDELLALGEGCHVCAVQVAEQLAAEARRFEGPLAVAVAKVLVPMVEFIGGWIPMVAGW